MKQLIFTALIVASVSFAHAQDSTMKVKKTSTPSQKVHNTFSKNKKYDGTKVKTTDSNGNKTTTKMKNDGDSAR